MCTPIVKWNNISQVLPKYFLLSCTLQKGRTFFYPLNLFNVSMNMTLKINYYLSECIHSTVLPSQSWGALHRKHQEWT